MLYKDSEKEIVLNSKMDDIDKGKKFIKDFFELHNIDIGKGGNILIVYDEIYSNIIKYAYNNNGGEAKLKLKYDNSIIEMTFMDKGPEFNPVKYHADLMAKPADEKINGGMGIMFCKKTMDTFDYERKDGYNILIMTKKLS